MICVGIIGADTKASWAGASHIPALAAQPQFSLEAVATRHEESARRAAETFGAKRWFADPYELIGDPSIDLVTVAVKVPAHRELVLAALASNKAVYAESPLGTTVAEAQEMAEAAGSLHTAIGLQGRLNPSVRRAAEMIAQGRLGRLLSARVTATTFGNGPESASAYEYFDKAAAGAGFLTIAAGHVLDVIETVLGDITEIDARTELLWPEVKLVDTGTTTVREVPDHLDAIGKTASGAPVGVQILAGVPVPDAHFGIGSPWIGRLVETDRQSPRGRSGRRPRAVVERGLHPARQPRRHRHRTHRRRDMDGCVHQRGRDVRQPRPRHRERDPPHPGVQARRPQQPPDRPGRPGRADRCPSVTQWAAAQRTGLGRFG